VPNQRYLTPVKLSFRISRFVSKEKKTLPRCADIHPVECVIVTNNFFIEKREIKKKFSFFKVLLPCFGARILTCFSFEIIIHSKKILNK
jgi:hypothetical protein